MPTSVDFGAREAVIARLEADYDQSLDQLDELNARLEACLTALTGKPTAAATQKSGVAIPAQSISNSQAFPLRDAA